MTKAEIVQRLLNENRITAEEAVVLLQQSSGIQYIPYQPNPYWTSNPDWTYDPNRPGQPWYTTSHTSGYSQPEGTADNQPKTTLTTNDNS